MSAVDRIKRLQEQKKLEEQRIAEQRRREKIERLRREEEEQRQRAEQERRRTQLRTEVGRSLMQNSGILTEIEAVKREFLSGFLFDRGKIVVDDDYCKIILAWGRVAVYKDGGSWYFGRSADCQYIQAVIDPDKRTITINGRTISEADWRRNRNAIAEAVAEAYLNPKREYPYAESSSSSSTSECCHS